MIEIGFAPRSVALDPVAAAATGGAAHALARRLLAGSDDEIARLSGVAGRGVIVVLGEPDALPWVDGAAYLGRDARAPALLLPTALEPTVPPALFERALTRRLSVATPIAVLAASRTVLSVARARPLSRARIEAWLAEEEGDG